MGRRRTRCVQLLLHGTTNSPRSQKTISGRKSSRKKRTNESICLESMIFRHYYGTTRARRLYGRVPCHTRCRHRQQIDGKDLHVWAEDMRSREGGGDRKLGARWEKHCGRAGVLRNTYDDIPNTTTNLHDMRKHYNPKENGRNPIKDSTYTYYLWRRKMQGTQSMVHVAY